MTKSNPEITSALLPKPNPKTSEKKSPAAVPRVLAKQQSGVSKHLDMSLLDDTLKEYGVTILNIYNEILDHVSYFLGIDDSAEAEGLKDFDRLEASTIVELLAVVQEAPMFPAEALQLLYEKLLELTKVNTTEIDLTVMPTPLPAPNIIPFKKV